MNHWRVPHKKFGTVRQKSSKKVVIVCYSKFFRYQNISQLQGSPYESFWYCETKTINKIVIPLLFKNFWNQNVSKHRRVPQRWFLGMWDKKLRKIVLPLLSKNFWYQNTYETQKGRLRCFSAIWDQKTSTKKRDNHFLSFLSKNFFRIRSFPKDKNVPPRCFAVLWDWKFSTENRGTPLLRINFLGALIFLNHWRLLHIFFGTVRQKQSTESWYPYYPTNFETRTILKHKRVRPRWFLAMWDKKVRQNCDTFIIEKLLIPEYFWNTEGFAHDVFRRFGTKKFRRKNVTPPSYPYFFRTRKILKHKSVPPRSFSVPWD